MIDVMEGIYLPNMFFLDVSEYAKMVSEINTNYNLYEGKRIGIHLSYGIDYQAYAYVFENRGFDDYIFIARDELD